MRRIFLHHYCNFLQPPISSVASIRPSNGKAAVFCQLESDSRCAARTGALRLGLGHLHLKEKPY